MDSLSLLAVSTGTISRMNYFDNFAKKLDGKLETV